ncbi:MAG: 30S ribosome-binding factor RbfA [Deltaproteobacteria bacterium]|nr:30S ribosome-binding factor RbfA [Deltaproteobacteria bacterium]
MKRTNTVNCKRSTRIADLIIADISDILLKQIGDPRIKSVTITGVKVTDDLRMARVFFVEMGKDTCEPQTEAALHNATGFIKRELAKRLKLRYVPDIAFVVDKSFAYGSRIDRLLAEIQEREADAE